MVKSSRKTYLILGVFFLALTFLFTFTAVASDSRPTPLFYVSASMTILSFCMAYLHPQFVEKDERMKLIRHKATMVTLFGVFIYLMIFMTVTQFDFISWPPFELFQIFASLVISTLFISLVIFAKRH